MQLRPLLGLLALVACGGKPTDASPPDPTDTVTDTPAVDDGTCVDDRTFFREQLWPTVIQPTCMACHTGEGAARESGLVFASPARPDHLDLDLATFRDIAGLERDGTSIVLLKPLGQEGHGGGAVLQEESDAYKLLIDFVGRVEKPVTCPEVADTTSEDAGLIMLSPAATLRKASLLLAGRLPSPDAVAAVRAGGEPALRSELDSLLEDAAFPERMMELYNDLFLTDRYLISRDGMGLIDDDVFPNKYWFEDAYASGNYDRFYDLSSDAIAREPLELVSYILREHRPWTELLTADYTMVNGFSAMVYGVTDAYEPASAYDPASLQFYPAQVPNWPHAGVLSTPAFVGRYPTTDTNRNRHRAWNVFKTFLGTDILQFAQRPIDPTISQVHNPTLNDPQCAVCHATMDPVAGLYQDFDEDNQLAPRPDGWYPDMRPPAFGDAVLPTSYAGRAVVFLGEQAAADPRFALAAVQNTLSLIASAEVLSAAEVGTDPVKLAALKAQEAFVDRVAADFRDGGYELRDVVRAVVLSRYFRAAESDGASEATLRQAGLGHLLTPEQLARKIRATVGMSWTRSYNQDEMLLNDYQLLYGGIDSFGTTSRLRDANGVISAVGLRMASDMACRAVTVDLSLPTAQRRLFPEVEPSYVPETPEGFAVAEARASIRANLAWLHYRLLGEELADDSPELEATWQLWYDTWLEYRDGVAAGTLSSTLPYQCDATEDPITGIDLPSELRVTRETGTIHAWMAVVSYLLADPRFLYE